MTNLASKDILARLLATENVTVVHANAPTASFNVKDRVLTLPMWEEMEGFTYDHLVGHEVGHALYTPEDGWHDAVCDRGPEFKTFLNVIEDARIERMIQTRYPGLRRSFIKSYRKMLDEGFFGSDLETINTYSLIDRINSHFKLGASAGVRIEKDELCWISEIDKADTWADVVDIAERLYTKALEEKAEQEEQQADEAEREDNSDLEADETDGSGDGFESDFDSDYENESDMPFETEEGETSESEMDGASEMDSFGGYEDDDISSKTDGALRKNIDQNFADDPSIRVSNITLSSRDYSDAVIGYKSVIDDLYSYQNLGAKLDLTGAKFAKDFFAANKRTVSMMVKEFEMRKSASDYVRATVSKTGVIDPVKMNSYRYNDDIFRKITVMPEGKNHGLMMLIDWSGSMAQDMKNTIDQLMNLVMFCRQVNIPHRVYAFTSGYTRESFEPEGKDAPLNTALIEGARLLELFSEKMKRNEFLKMSAFMMAYADVFVGYKNYGGLGRRSFDYYDFPVGYQLGGTPLDHALIMMPSLFAKFKADNRLDIVNTVILTDGDSHSACAHTKDSFDRLSYSYHYSKRLGDLCNGRYNRNKRLTLVDEITKKRYPVSRSTQLTEVLLKRFQDCTGSNAIGFRILPKNSRSMKNELSHMSWDAVDKLRQQMKKDKYATIPGRGYAKYFGVYGSELEVSDGALEVEEGATKGKIRTAFKKANKGKTQSRVLLTKFIEMIA